MYQPEMYIDTKSYDSNCSVPKISAKNAIMKYLKEGNNVNKSLSGRVLDVACGQGAVTELLCSFLEPKAEVDAVDISNEVLEYAKRNYSHLKVNFVQLDACAPFPERLKGSYDLVFSNFLFHWATDHRTLLKNFLVAMKDGGECVICFFSHFKIWSAYRIMAKRETWSQYMGDVEQFITPYHDDVNADVNFKKVMLECGFRSVNTEIRHIIYDDEYDACKAIARNVDPFMHRIPIEIKEKYMNEFMDVLVGEGFFAKFDPESKKGGPVKINGSVLIAIGQK